MSHAPKGMHPGDRWIAMHNDLAGGWKRCDIVTIEQSSAGSVAFKLEGQNQVLECSTSTFAFYFARLGRPYLTCNNRHKEEQR